MNPADSPHHTTDHQSHDGLPHNPPRDSLPHDQRRARRPNTPDRLFRSRHDRVWGGVLGGMGQYVGIDPHVLRISYVLITIITGGIAAVGYVLLWWLIPLGNDPNKHNP